MPNLKRKNAERRQKLLDLLIDHDALDPDVLVQKIEALYGKNPQTMDSNA